MSREDAIRARTDIEVARGLAIFGLGRFIDYRLDEGMAEEDLFPFMQAYLTLTAHHQGLEPPDLFELRARKVALSPELAEALRACTPDWLPDDEKLRLFFPERRTTPCSSDPESRG